MSKVIVKQFEIPDDEWKVIQTGGMISKTKTINGKLCKVSIMETTE